MVCGVCQWWSGRARVALKISEWENLLLLEHLLPVLGGVLCKKKKKNTSRMWFARICLAFVKSKVTFPSSLIY